MSEERIISAEESFTGEAIDISSHPTDVQDVIKGFQRAYTKKRQREMEELNLARQEIEELREMKEEYNQILEDPDFIEWVTNRTNKEKASDSDDEIIDPSVANAIARLEEKIALLEEDTATSKKDILARNIEADLLELQEWTKKENLPSVEDVWTKMIAIAKNKKDTSPDGRCNLTAKELYFSAIGHSLPDIINRQKVPFFEGGSRATSDGGEDKGLFSVLENISKSRRL